MATSIIDEGIFKGRMSPLSVDQYEAMIGARLIRAATGETPERAIADLIATATDYPLLAVVLYAHRELGRPDFAAQFLPLAADPAWDDARLGMLGLFADLRVVGADTNLEQAWRAAETPIP